MREVTDSERIFKKATELAKLVTEYDKEVKRIEDENKDLIEQLENMKQTLCRRIDNLRDYYHEITKPGFKIPKKGFK
jgi:predicted nuclease with TOPRIM domain